MSALIALGVYVCVLDVCRFNLADPAVMSTLFPILEGGKSIRIPGTSKDIVATEGFRFFATQNDAM
jgi:MoxR-like ATPase